MKPNVTSSETGLTLIETMIALFVFSVGILAVASMQSISLKSNAKARQVMQNALTAGATIEQILAMPFDDARLVDKDRAYDPQHPDHGPFALQGSPSTIEWEIHDDFPAPHLKRITVTVRRKAGALRGGQTSYDVVRARDFY